MAMVIVLKTMESSWMRLGRETLEIRLSQGSNWCLAVPGTVFNAVMHCQDLLLGTRNITILVVVHGRSWQIHKSGKGGSHEKK